MRLKIITVLLLLLIMTACGGGNDNNTSTQGPPADDGVSVENGQANSEQVKPEDPPNSDLEPDEQIGSEQSNGETEEQNEDKEGVNDAEATEPMYTMNEYYLLVPKHEHVDKKAVLLTFDDGPKEKEMIDTMLEVLDKHDAKAIFFVNGYRVEQNPDLLKLLYDSGNAIGNHSWDHINLREESDEKIDQQVEDVQSKIAELVGEAPLFFRPPHGAGNDYLKEKVKAEGMLYMTWSTSPEDWLKENQTADMIIKNTLERVHPGANLLMHELPWTVEALDTLLTELSEEGYSFIDPHTIEIPVQTEAP